MNQYSACSISSKASGVPVTALSRTVPGVKQHFSGELRALRQPAAVNVRTSTKRRLEKLTNDTERKRGPALGTLDSTPSGRARGSVSLSAAAGRRSDQE